MSHNKVKLSQIIRDFILTSDSDDFANNVSDSAIRNFALRGIREIGFDLGKSTKSLKLDINSSNNTVSLPDDFVDLSKIGVVGSDGLVYVFTQNKNLNMSRRMQTATDTSLDDQGKYGGALPDGVTDEALTGGLTDVFDANPANISANSIGDRIDDKNSTTGAGHGQGDLRDYYIFDNYLFEGGFGRMYGIGGGHHHG